MAADAASLRIFRYDPERGEERFFQNYQIPLESNTTILDTLIYVYENLDSTLAFNYGCRYGSCGTCAVKVNGKPKLACKELAEPEMIIEPLSNFKIVRDLVIDRNIFNEKSKRIRPFLERGPKEIIQPESLNPLEFEEFRHVYQCIECLSCDSVCPSMSGDSFLFSGPATFVQMARQMFDPRDQLDRTLMAYSEGLYHCLRCAKCREVCPYSIDIPEVIIKKIREKNLTKGLSPPELDGVIKEMDKHGRPFSMMSVPKSALISQLPRLVETDDACGEVTLFLGCNIAYHPRLLQTGKTGIDVLKKKWNVKIPQGLQCCGLPLIEIGAKEKFSEAVRKNVNILEASGAKEVVTLCPGCAMTMRNDWPVVFEALEGRKPEFMVYDFVEFCTERMELNKKEMKNLPMKVTYHEPCHANRYLGLSAKTRKLINQIPGVELVEMKEPDRCCGGGGEVMVVNSDLTGSLADKKIDMIDELGVDAMVTSCPTCILQLGRALSMRKIKGIQMLHLVTLIDMAYR